MSDEERRLATMPCARCGRPFVSRLRFESVWKDVRFCSEACADRDARSNSVFGAALETISRGVGLIFGRRKR